MQIDSGKAKGVILLKKETPDNSARNEEWIPAFAGMTPGHGASRFGRCHRRKSSIRLKPETPASSDRNEEWIPAFAGMTPGHVRYVFATSSLKKQYRTTSQSHPIHRQSAEN
jgi:hypothetical protein